MAAAFRLCGRAERPVHPGILGGKEAAQRTRCFFFRPRATAPRIYETQRAAGRFPAWVGENVAIDLRIISFVYINDKRGDASVLCAAYVSRRISAPSYVSPGALEDVR
jgi:hypothetical protein